MVRFRLFNTQVYNLPKVGAALPMRVSSSAYNEFVSLTVDPRYANLLTTSKVFPSIIMFGGSTSIAWVRITVLPMLIIIP